jgi:hypothetical protein
MAAPVFLYGFFSVVTIAENNIQFVDALFHPMLKHPQIKLSFKGASRVVIVDFGEMDVGKVFSSFVEEHWFKWGRRLS